jgi:hypothetical protein
MPKEHRYDPQKHKIFFKNEIEVFQSIPDPDMEEKKPQTILYPKIVQVLASPPAPRNPVAPMRQPEQSKNVVDLWFKLFSDILGNEKLTKKFCNSLDLVLGIEESPETRIRTNLPQKNTERLQRRKIGTGKEFRLASQLYEFEIKDVMLDIGYDVNILHKKTWEAQTDIFHNPVKNGQSILYFSNRNA